MTYTADIIGLLRTLAIIFLVFWGFRIIGRYILPWLGKWAIRKAGQRMQDQVNVNFQQSQKRREDVIKDDGNIKISKTKSSSDEGEFVDFEEID